MKIRLIMDVPVSPVHKMTAGRELEVIDKVTKVFERGNEDAYWVQGQGEKVKIWAHECEEVKPFAGRYLVTDPCYVVPDSTPEEILAGKNKWGDWLDQTNFGEDVGDGTIIPGVGKIIKSGSTSCGDGTWSVAKGEQEISADAGLVCIVELEDSFNADQHCKDRGYHPMFSLGAVTESRVVAEAWFAYVQMHNPWE